MSENQTPSHDPAPERWKSIIPVALILVFAAVWLGRNPSLLVTIVAFVVILSILVFVHEWGHFQFARWSGMKVNRFAVGFPPFILNHKKNGVIYSIGALPIGGMVDIAGLGSEEEMVGTAKGEAISPVRDTNRPWGQRQFQDGSLFQRFMVLFAGPLMNFLFAIALAIFLFSVAGVLSKDTKFNLIREVVAGSPAQKAGVQPDDLLVGVNNVRTDDSIKLQEAIQKSNGQPVVLSLRRNGQIVTETVTPRVEEVPLANGEVQKIPIVGIVFAPDPATVSYERVGIGVAVKRSFEGAWLMTTSILQTIKRALTASLTRAEREGIGGPVKIAQAVGQVAQQGDWRQLAQVAAALSINLGLLNLLPFPALDGGRILFLGYELVARRPAPPRVENVIHAAGMLVLLAFMLFITVRDIAPMVQNWIPS